ncbi:MAG: RNA polymerase sigma factor [Thiohalomonadales bacterium]
MSEHTDSDLLHRYLDGDDTGLERLVKRYQADIYRFIYRMVGNEADAADLSQKVFVKLFLKAGTFQQQSSFKTWLFQIAVNQCKNHYRSNDRRRIDDNQTDIERLGESGYDAIETYSCQEQRKLLMNAVDKLPERQKATMKLRIQMDCTFKEIAEIMTISVGTAKAHYHQAVTSLKHCIKDNDYETHKM